MSDGRPSMADDDRPDFKWVVEWLVEREGQRKTVALALQRERLTGRMTLAVQRLMANLDDPGWERTTPLDRLEARIRLALEAVHELAALVESLTQRVEALEAAQKPEDDAGGQEVGGGARRRGSGLASVQLEAGESATGRGKERWMSRSAG